MPALALPGRAPTLDAHHAMEASAKVMIRPYRSEDRARVVELVGVDVTASGTGLRVQVAEEVGTGVLGAVVYRLPDGGGDAQLGAVVSVLPNRWDVFYGLVRATAEDALAAGHSTAVFTVRDRRLLDKIAGDFRVAPEASGWEPSATNELGAPVEWLVVVDLADALAQLDRALERLGAGSA